MAALLLVATAHAVPPTALAVDDTYSVPMDGSLQTSVQNGLLANDTYSGSDYARLGTASAHGWTLMVERDGTFLFEPEPGFSGRTSFTYEIRESSGQQLLATGTATIDVMPPLTLHPDAGALPPATIDSPYTASFAYTGSGGPGPKPIVVSGGALPPGLTLASGILSGTPTELGTFTFTLTLSEYASSNTDTKTYTLEVLPPPNSRPNVMADTYTMRQGQRLTVAAPGVLANDSDSEGDPLTAAIVTPPTDADSFTLNSNGSFDYLPPPSFVGTASFQYRASDAGGPSVAAATVYVEVTAPPLTLVPAAGSLPGATVGQSYATLIEATGGTGDKSYAMTDGGMPVGLMLLSDGRLAGTPSHAGSYSFEVTATDAAMPPATTSATYTLEIAEPAALVLTPAAGALPAGIAHAAYGPVTVAASGGAEPYQYQVSTGSLPEGVSLDATLGTLSGTPLESGAFSFTVTAYDANEVAGSAAYTLTIDPASAVTLSFTPAAGALPAATVGTPVTATVVASGGTGSYTYAVAGSLPPGVTFNANGTASGTPTTAGTFTFTVTATDSATPANTGSAIYSLTVQEAGTPPAAVLTFTPLSGALPAAMAGEAYTGQITATGGTGPLQYRMSGAPAGLVLNFNTGALNGPLASGTEGSYTIAVTVTDANGLTGTASYTLAVVTQAVVAIDKTQPVPPGATPPPVDLTAGASGGPFTMALVAFVQPPEAGTAEIVSGELADNAPVVPPLGWYLKFHPNPGYTGTAVVGYQLVSALGTSNTGTVTYTLGFDPQQVATDIDAMVHGFIEARQGLLTSALQVPGLMQRRAMANGNGEAVLTEISPSEDSVTINAATSLAQLEAARTGGVYDQPFNIWADGTLMLHNRAANGDRWGTFAMLSAGMDYLLNDKALIGLSLHIDQMSDPIDADAEITGRGWLAGPYASLELGQGVFFDTSLLYGGSSNDIDTAFFDGSFDTSRWLIDAKLSGQWHFDEATLLTPMVRAVYLNETADGYTVTNALGDILAIDGFTSEQFRLSLGAELEHTIALDNGLVLTPSVGATIGWSALSTESLFGSLTAGLSLANQANWTMDAGVLVNFDNHGATSAGGKIGVKVGF